MTASTDSDPLPYPFGPAQALTPHPRYAQLRSAGIPRRIRMPYGQGTAWLVTRYADARTVLADQRFSRAAAAGRDVPRARPHPDPPELILSMDPPQHTRVRGLLATAFTTRRVSALQPCVQAIVDSLLDAMIASGRPADLVDAVAWPLPVAVICTLLGVPDLDHAAVRSWTEATLALGADTQPAQITAARDNLNDYLTRLIAERRAHPGNDLLSDLIAARDRGDRLTEPELVRLGVTLVIAGHETTASQLGNFTYLLLSEPDRWDSLVADPALIPHAVEELSRYVPLNTSVDFARIATVDLELGGQRIAAGDAVLVQLHAANRDTAAFDRPDKLDLQRVHNPHLAFGYGVHHCVGAALARMELRVALDTLSRRLPTLRLAIPAGQVPWRADRLVRSARCLPVTW